MASCAVLSDRAVIAVDGADAREFLQGLITNDISLCDQTRGIYAALLTPQGKILYDFFIAGQNGGFLIDCAAAHATEFVKRLTVYRLRAKVTIAARAELAVAAIWGAPLPTSLPGLIALPDPRLGALGLRAIGEAKQIEAALSSTPRSDYHVFRLSLGVPDSEDLPPDQVFALDTGFDELHGVSFSKGCYVGQEVTARMKHRATARRRFFIIESGMLPPAGTAIELGGRELGRMASSRSERGLALIRLDRLAEAEAVHAPIEAEGKPVTLRKPDWLGV